MAMAMAMAATASSSSSSLSTLTAGAPTLRGGLTPLLAAPLPLPLPLPLPPRRSLRGRVSLTCPPRGAPPSVARAAKSAAETTVRSPEWPTSSSASSSAASAMAAAVIAATAAWTDSAAAAEEMMKVAASASASDARGTLLLLPVVPAVVWVVYNILRPALSQLERMRGARGVAFWAGLGLGVGAGAAGVWQAPHAQAATEDVLGLGMGMGGSVFELGAAAAQSDSRGSIILVVLLPAVLWVLYNILRPALNQLDRMRR